MVSDLAPLLALLGLVLLVCVSGLLIMRTTSVTLQTDSCIQMRCGLWLDSAKLTWPMAEVSLDANRLVISPRSGLAAFREVTIERDVIRSIRTVRGPFGKGIELRGTSTRRVVVWPGNANLFLCRWRDLGWPDTPADEQ